jgi:hydrogenase maturation protein HypF
MNHAEQDDQVIIGMSIRVRGIVQGVGFRPSVWRLARNTGVHGAVRNDADGVLIEAWGPVAVLENFVRRLEQEPPPLARIDAVEVAALDTGTIPDGFDIVASQGGRPRTDVSPDTAACPACLADINDPHNRRYRYPFTNCTHCGPRLSIIRAVPYDRNNTSMAPFTMCPACLD